VIPHRQRSCRSAADNHPRNAADACRAAYVRLHTVPGFMDRRVLHRGLPFCCTVPPLMRLLGKTIVDYVSESRIALSAHRRGGVHPRYPLWTAARVSALRLEPKRRGAAALNAVRVAAPMLILQAGEPRRPSLRINPG
jgi:hypothetical protein